MELVPSSQRPLTVSSTSEPSAAAPRAVVSLAKNQGEAVWFFEQLVIVKLRGPDAPYGVLETELGPGGGTPFHRHTDEDEAFYLLDGELSIFLEGGRMVRARPGSYVHIPRGVAHGLRAHTHVRALVLSNPTGFVDFAREAGTLAPRLEVPPPRPVDVEKVMALAAKYHIELIGPLPE
jgi:quercetin dioxygenase-like cupin family protein